MKELVAPLSRKIFSALMALILVAGLLPVSFPDKAYAESGNGSQNMGVSVGESTDSLDGESDSDVSQPAAQDATQNVFEFIYVDQKTVELGESQSVVVGFADKAKASDSELTYQDSNGVKKSVKASKVSDGAALFEIPFGSASECGKYKLVKVSWTNPSDGEAVVPSNDDGYSFEVSQKTNRPEDEDVISVYSLNESGEMVEQENLADAIESTAGRSEDDGIAPFALNNGDSRASKRMVIALDAGHGGSDPGAESGSLEEKTLTLKIAQYCKAELDNYAGVTTYMVRSTDEYVGLSERVQRAVNAGANLFVSFHINSAESQATGFEVWVQNDSSWRYELHTQSSQLGNSILSKLSALGLTNRGNKESDSSSSKYADGSAADRLAVLRESRMNNIPAVLVEHGFINGKAADQNLLSSEDGLKKMGIADAQGIVKQYGLSKASESNNEDAKIMGETKATVDQMVRYFESSGHNYPSGVYASKGAASLRDFCQIAYEEAKAEGVRAEVLFCQAMKETGWLQFGGDVRAGQCNFGGLGATGNSAQGASFSSVREGLRAQVQHLKAYASTDSLVNACVDPRFGLVNRGCAPYLQDLNGKWAVPGNGYGEDIQGMIYSLLGESANAPAQNCYSIDNKYSAPASAEVKTVENGEYLIQSALASKSVIRANGSGNAWESALTLNESDMSSSQKFVFERDATTGFYRIKESKSGKYLGLDESDGRYSPNILLKSYYASDNSLLWKISESNGAYTIGAAVNDGYCLDVSNASSANGTKVTLFSINGNANQRFSLISTSPEVEGGRTVDDGVYSVSLGSDGSVALGVSGSATGDGGNVQATAPAGLASQKFRFTLKEDGFYEVRNLNSGKVLDVDHGNMVPGTNILQWSDYASDNQRWAVQRCDGGYRLVCKANGLALTLGASAGPGSNAFASTVADGQGQVLSLEPAALERVVSDGEYVVSSQVDPMQVFDIAGASTANCARLEVYESHMADNQIFRFERDDDTGFYKVTCVGSGKVLDNDNRSVSNGAAVLQYDSTGALNQRWIVQREGSGLSIRSAIDPSYCIDLTGGGASNCTKAEMYRYNGGANQRFSLVSTNIAPVSESEDFGLEGWYEISPVTDSALCVDIFNASSENGAKSLLYNKNSNLNQLFKLEYQNGFYRLVSASSGKALELKDGSVIPGVPAQQKTISDSMSQKWKITKNQDGSYSFVCAANGLKLGSAEVGSNVALSGRDGGAGENTSFCLTKRTDLLKEGVFKIAYGKDRNKVFDIDNASRANGANALIYSSNSNLNQKWKVKLVSGMENTYTFESLCSGKYLSASGSNVVQSSFSDGSKEQMWTPVDIDAGAVILQNVATGKVLDVEGGGSSNGTNVQIYERNNSSAQKFVFEPTELVKTATYVFRSGANYGQVIDLNNASTQDGATVTTWTSNNGGNQKWNLSGNGDGTYRISNAANGKVLDVSGGTVSDGAQVVQYSWHNGLNQKWYVVYDKEGGFVFESAQNRDVVLAVGSPAPSNGSSIRVEKKTGAANQRFCLEQTVYTPPMPSDRQAMQNRIWGYGSGTQWLIGVDRSTHRVGVFRGSANNWTLQYWWSCVTGAPGTPTITGYYRTSGGKRMSLSTDSRAKWCTQIWNGYFFHTILNSDAELGNSLSHGCLRMSYPSAQWIYNNIYAGTAVVIYN